MISVNVKDGMPSSKDCPDFDVSFLKIEIHAYVAGKKKLKKPAPQLQWVRERTAHAWSLHRGKKPVDPIAKKNG